MNLKDFISNVLVDIDAGIDAARQSANRRIWLASQDKKRTVEFDIAVTIEEKGTGNGKAGIKVLKFVESGVSISQENTNSTVSRITFGVNMPALTKEEEEESRKSSEASRAARRSRTITGGLMNERF
jgi:hypothetical protein